MFSGRSFSWRGGTELWWSCRICTHIPYADKVPAGPGDLESVYERWPSGCPVSCILYRTETRIHLMLRNTFIPKSEEVMMHKLFTWTSVDVEDISEEVWKQSLQKKQDILKFLQHPHQQIMFQNVLLRHLQCPHARLSDGLSHTPSLKLWFSRWMMNNVRYKCMFQVTCIEDAAHRNMGWCRTVWDWSILGDFPRCTC